MKINIINTIVSLIFLLLIIVNSTHPSTSIINRPQRNKAKYHTNNHQKLKSIQKCKSLMHCNETITIKASTFTVVCIAASLNIDQLILSTPYHNFGCITADIVDGSYNENIFIPPYATKYLTKYYGFDMDNYYPHTIDTNTSITIPLRLIPPAINITHDITVECMQCDQNICGQTIISNNGEIKRFCIETHVNSDNPSYISQFVFRCEVGSCLVQVYDYMNELEFSMNFGGRHERKIEFNDFNIGEAYTIEFSGNLVDGSDSNTSKLIIECYDPLLHTVAANAINNGGNNNNNINPMKNVQEFIMLLTMVAVMGVIITSYVMQKVHTSQMQTQTVWDDL